MYHITHHGAADGVTGSCHQLTLHNGAAVLVDCGLFQGAEVSDNNPQTDPLQKLLIEFPIDTIKALVVTHCHIDHVGRIPYLLAAGFDGPIYATEASAHLLPMVLEDAIKVGITRDGNIINSTINLLKERLIAVPYKQWFEIQGAESHK